MKVADLIRRFSVRFLIIAGVISSGLSGCSSSNSDNENSLLAALPGFGAKYTIGGSVSGLVGSGLTLQNNGGDNVTVNSDGTFTFPTGLSNKAVYSVSISQQPTNPCQPCTVTNDSGTITKADVANVTVTCGTPSYSLGGTVYGLGQGRSLTLQVTGGQTLTINTNGPFTFPSLVEDGSSYGVTVATAPLSQSCTLTSGSGTISHANVGSIAINCAYQIGLFSYAANAGSNSITINRINTLTGQMTSAGTAAAGNYPVSLAIAPSSKFLYTANENDNTVSGFAINQSTGALTAVPGSPYAAGSSPYYVTVDPYSRFVFAVNTISNSVTPYMINSSTGALTTVFGSPAYGTGQGPTCITVEPMGKFAYVSNNIDNTVSAFTIDQTTGALMEISGSPYPASGPQGIAIDPTGSVAFIVNQNSSKINTYTIAPSTGALTLVGSYSTGDSPLTVAVHPTANFVYVANFNSSNISAFSYAMNGVLTPTSASVFSTGSHPSSIAIDPTGRFMHVSSMTGSAYAYSINPTTGFLTPAPGGHFPIGSSPMSIATLLPGIFTFYVLRYDDNAIDAYSLNINTGGVSLTQSIPFSVFGGSGTSPVIDPTGRFLHVSSSGLYGANYANAFSIDPGTGALTGISGSPFNSNEDGVVAIHPSGKFSYVSGHWDFVKNNFSFYNIDPATGKLSGLGGTFPQNNMSNEFLFDPLGEFAFVINFQTHQQTSQQLNVYTVNPLTGAFTDNVPGSPYTSLQYPQSITFDPAGNFMFMIEAGLHSVSVHAINRTSGALTHVAGSPFPAQTEASNMTMHPSGQFVYVATYDMWNTCTVTGFSVNQTSGALAAIPGASVNAGSRTNSLFVDTTGKYLLVMNGGEDDGDPDCNVSVFIINPSTGALTAVYGSPFAVNFNTGGTTSVNYTVK